MTTEQANKQVVQNFLTALGKGDVTAMAATLSTEVQAIAMGTGALSGTRDYDTILAAAGMLGAITKDGISFDIVSMTAEEDRVSAEAKGRSTLVNGTPYNNEYHFLFTLREGRIIRMKEYYCTKLTEDALGPMLAQQAAS